MGVQRLARKRNGPQLLGTEDVATLADERVATQSGLDSDLVSFAGFEPHIEQRRIAKLLDDGIAADRLGALRIARMRPLLNESLPIPHQVVAPGSCTRFWMTVDQREIDPFGFALDELLLQRLLCTRILRTDHHTRRTA